MCSASSSVLLDGSVATAQDCGGFLLPSSELSQVHLALLFPSRSPSGCLPIYGLLLCFLWAFLGGGHFPSPPLSGNVLWGPISLMNELCRGRISHLQSFLNRQLLILDIFLIFWTFPGLVSGLHLPVSSSSPSAFKTGFSSYSATSCSSQRGALPCPLLPLFGKLAELQRTSWTFLGQWQWMCFWM